MNRMMAIVEREMRKFFRSPALMLVAMVFPLVQLIVLGNAFGGKIRDAKRDMTVVNAAGGFVVAGLAKDLKEGIDLAREEMDSGRALDKLRALQSFQPKRSA